MRTHPRRPALACERLEARDVPAVTIQLDYSFDALGFFNDPTRRAVFQQAAYDLGASIDTPLAAVFPGGGNTWTGAFTNPATGGTATVPNAVVGANTLVVYVAGRDLAPGELGVGGPGTFSAGGSSAWQTLLRNRTPSGGSAWGGSIAFDTSTSWYFGASPVGIGRGQTDFYSVAVHELGHVLGIGTSRRWNAQVTGGAFVGPTAEAVYGGPVPVTSDAGHWRAGTTVNGTPAAMDPAIGPAERMPFTLLDYAALADLGWAIGTGPAVTPVATTFANPKPWTGSWTSLATVDGVVVLSGVTAGTARAFTTDSTGKLVAVGPTVTPFIGGNGAIRAVAADFDGDGTPDLAFGTGDGATAAVRILNGRTGADLVPATSVLDGFGGGVYLAAGDADGDGRAELAVSADAGGGTRITLFRVTSRLTTLANFLAFDDPDFRGGSRVAMGDVNHDGADDLIVGAGIGGGPRVAVYDGRSVPGGRPTHLTPDFFALDPNLRSGVFVTSADLDADGYADVLYSTGITGGPRVRVVGGKVLTDNPGRNAFDLPALADFFALDAGDRSGLRVAARDLNGDGAAEVVAASGA
ncbi:MAG: FG-GAP-like repeat-containing protein, partial [Gemmataceae bacterium]|nr:FG-GAP-like repeat-containing protein [Gemmataceae bacterium]